MPMKPKKPLTWLFPDAVAREYEADLRQFARAITQAVADALHLHQDDWRSDLLKILMDLPQQLEQQTEQAALSATLHAQAVNRFNDTQFHRVVSSAYGQDFYKPEPFLKDALETWTLENARLIKSIPEQYIGQIQQMVSDAAVNGWDEATLKQKIQASFRLPENRAALIANDQIGKLNGQLTRLRQQNIGIKKYRWRGKRDERERDSHLKREGKVFEWDNPPSGGHPGSEINCRCYAQMIAPEIEEIDALFFGDGGNRHHNAEMTRRGLTPETGGATVYANPFAQYGYLPRGGAGSLKQVLETVARQAVQAVAVETVANLSVTNPSGFSFSSNVFYDGTQAQYTMGTNTFSREELASIAAMADGSLVKIEKYNDGLMISAKNPDIYTAELQRILIYEDNRLILENEYQEIIESQRGKGIPVFALYTQIQNARALGVSIIRTLAAGSMSSKLFNGYYTWARLGFDAELPINIQAQLPEKFINAEKVSDLMATPEGRDWWRVHGKSLYLEFDLSDNSQSIINFKRYLKERFNLEVDI